MRDRAPADILFKPGINVQFTPALNEGGWSDCNLIRFRDGLPESIGGWQRASDDVIVGTARCLMAWQDLTAYPYLGIGTEQRLLVYTPGVINDITPLRATANQAPSFDTTSGLTSVTVNDAGHGATAGDWVRIVNVIAVGGLLLQGFYLVQSVTNANAYVITAATAATATVAAGGVAARFYTTNTLTSVTVNLPAHGYAVTELFTVNISTVVGGITFSGEYAVQSVTDANNFVITSTSAASSTANGYEHAGNVRIEYLLGAGLANSVLQTGWGTGAWGSGPWGISSSTAGVSPLRQWSMDAWGEILLAAPSDGSVYAWDPSGGFAPASLVATAPTINTQILVATPQRQLVCLGAEVLGVQDPLLIRYSDVDDYTAFTATVTNQAGSNRLPSGSAIIGGLAFDLNVLIWTDADMWSMQYQGLPFVYGFNKVATNCGLIAQRAVATMGSRLYWMSGKGFFESTGSGAQQLDCSVWDFVFKDLDQLQTDKIFAASNTLFNEVFWFFPSASGSGEVDSYVKFNTLERVWDKGTLPRTAWVDKSVFGAPIAADENALLQQHETGETADGAMLESWVQSGDVALTQGQTLITIDRVLADMRLSVGGAVDVTISALNYPNVTAWTKGPYEVDETSTFFRPRIKGRRANFKIEAKTLATFWRLGRMQYEWSLAGSR